jgi:hypothetical protein
MRMKDAYEQKFGEFFGESEVAPALYAHGWNDALDEAARQIGLMTGFGDDTISSFSVFVRGLKAPANYMYTDDSK